MKKFYVPFLSMFILLFLFNSSALAKTTNILYINNSDETNSCIIVQGRILVSKTGLSSLTETNWQWNHGNIVITNTDTKDTIKIKIGGSVLYKNGEAINMAVPVRYYNGKAYVSLRAYAEAMGAKIFTVNRSIYVYSIDSDLVNETKSEDLSVARMATLKLKRCDSIDLHLSFKDDMRAEYGEPMPGTEYLFPEGEVNRFFYYDNNYESLTYYEVKDGIPWKKWEGQLLKNNDGNAANAINMLQEKVCKEIGERPLINKRIYNFYFNCMSYRYWYGCTDTNGNYTMIGDTMLEDLVGDALANEMANDMYIPKISGEVRTD